MKKPPVLLDTVVSTEERQNSALERPATKLVAITSQSKKPTGRGTIQNGINDIHEEPCVSHLSPQQDRHSGTTSEHWEEGCLHLLNSKSHPSPHRQAAWKGNSIAWSCDLGSDVHQQNTLVRGARRDTSHGRLCTQKSSQGNWGSWLIPIPSVSSLRFLSAKRHNLLPVGKLIEGASLTLASLRDVGVSLQTETSQPFS